MSQNSVQRIQHCTVQCERLYETADKARSWSFLFVLFAYSIRSQPRLTCSRLVRCVQRHCSAGVTHLFCFHVAFAQQSLALADVAAASAPGMSFFLFPSFLFPVHYYRVRPPELLSARISHISASPIHGGSGVVLTPDKATARFCETRPSAHV